MRGAMGFGTAKGMRNRVALWRLGLFMASCVVVWCGVLGGKVAAENYTVTANPTSVNPGDTITVSWTAPGGHSASDWIDLYKSGSGAPISTRQVGSSSTSGSLTFKAPMSSGTYELHYYLDGTSANPVVRSNTVIVN